jgi:hypothetical protein
LIDVWGKFFVKCLSIVLWNVAKRKRTIGQTKIYKTLHKKINKSSNTNPTKIRGELMCSGRVIGSCVTE